jgi:hypothetical protein
MSEEIINLPSLSSEIDIFEGFIQSKSILRLLIEQIKKDHLSAGFPVKILLNKKYSFAELSDLLIQKYLTVTSSQLSQLLYRVDISETQLAKQMNSPGLDLKVIADMIIKRELQKVILRLKYSADNNQSSY